LKVRRAPSDEGLAVVLVTRPDRQQARSLTGVRACRFRQRLDSSAVAALALLLSAIVVVAVLASVGSSLADPDVWWHVRTGRLILDTHAVPHTDPFSFTADRDSWVPTAWLSDASFALVWKVGGWEAIRVLRIVLAVAVAAALWLAARRRTDVPAPSAALAVALVMVTLQPFLRERPQVIAFLFVAWLAVVADNVLRGRMPPVLLCAGLGYLWANVHGMWILLPGILLLAGVLAWVDDRERVALAARCTSLAVLVGVLACLTPVGPRLAVWPLVVRNAAAPVTEWHPTVLDSRIGVPFACLVGVIVWSWARRDGSVSRGRALFVLSVTGFGMLAFRNVAPAAILLLPELTRGIRSLAKDWTPRSLPGTSWPLPAAVGALGVIGATLVAATSPLVSRDQPVRLAELLAQRPGELRVLNDYDVGGLITGLASPPAHVAIDGRTDMWPASYVREYVAATTGAADWRPLVDRLDPNAAVVLADSDLARGLVLERRWRVTAREGIWALLEPPSAEAP
jgi:hypothetical protein